MGVRGRKTVGDKVVQLRDLSELERPKPPKYLNKAAAQEWREIVAMYPVERFLRGVWPILEAYCAHAIENRKAMARLDALLADAPMRDVDLAQRVFERESKMVASFGVRLGIARTSMSGRHNNDPETVAESDLPWEV